MIAVISLLLLAFAVSLDGFGVGVMYGMRKIRIPLLSIGIIALCSGIIIFLSMQLGVMLTSFILPSTAKIVGAAILICIGIWALFQMMQAKHQEADKETAPISEKLHKTKRILYIELKRFGLVIQILRTPSIADVDRSGNISASEATLLGVALSLDAFGAGIGAALIGFPPFVTAAVIALSSGIFIAVGLPIGLRFAERIWMRNLSMLPGCVLILMGIMKLM
jgi:putative sporulation protein YtaF